MTEDLNQAQLRIVSGYNLADYVIQIAELAAQGWKVDTETNEGFPRGSMLSGIYTVHMLKPALEFVKLAEADPLAETEVHSKTRKAKVKVEA